MAIFQYPFAVNGDRNTNLPNASDPNNLVSFQNGFTSLYSITPAQGGKYIERKDFNEIMYRTTKGINDLAEASATHILTSTGDALGYIDIGTVYYCSKTDKLYVLRNNSGVTVNTTLANAIANNKVVALYEGKVNTSIATVSDLWVSINGITFANVGDNSYFKSIKALQNFIYVNKIYYSELRILIDGNKYTPIDEGYLWFPRCTIDVVGQITFLSSSYWFQVLPGAKIVLSGGSYTAKVASVGGILGIQNAEWHDVQGGDDLIIRAQQIGSVYATNVNIHDCSSTQAILTALDGGTIICSQCSFSNNSLHDIGILHTGLCFNSSKRTTTSYKQPLGAGNYGGIFEG